MSRNKKSNDILTKEKHVKVGKKVIRHGIPQLLVGPNANQDYFSMQDMAEAMYGRGAKFYIEEPTE